MRYGLIGEKLGHSYSKIIHEKLGAYDYELIPLAKDEIADFMEARDFTGLNVTIPYKQTVMEYCDEISDLAKTIGAVNTLYLDDQGRLCGTNTDYHGFLYAIVQAGLTLQDKKILILGDGATRKTICHAVFRNGAREIVIASRKVNEPITEELSSACTKAQESIRCTTVNYGDLTAISDAEIIINTTPVGMWPHTDAQPVDLACFANCCGVFDVIYNPRYTKLLQQAKDLNIPHAGGLSMLVAQATAAAEYFTGISYDGETLGIIDQLQTEMK